jgi:molecular chaperone DnaK
MPNSREARDNKIRRMSTMEKIFGIDLGTTNSEIAYMKDGVPCVVTTENNEKYIPSVVGVDLAGKIIVGFPARNQYAAFPENTVASIKRKMGSNEKVVIAGKEYTPPEISAMILRYLANAAERETGLDVKKVVITVPAYFSDLERKDTLTAGELAGLDVVRIINEPTAAALAYECKKNVREKIMVYDLGGGTFDISLIDIEDDVIEVMATDGDTHLGGDDFDLALKNLLISGLPEGSIPENDLKAGARLKNIAEETKIKLSTESRIQVREEFITTFKGKPVHLDQSLSRTDFEDCIEENLEKTFTLMEKVLKERRLDKKDVSKVLLVGGSTYIPKIISILSDDLGFDVHREVDPTLCVAIGAAIQGAIIAGEKIDSILVDVSSHSLGIRCLDFGLMGSMNNDMYSIVIHRNTPIPASMTKTFYTVTDGQKCVEIKVYQGEKPMVTDNTFLGSFLVDNLPKNLKANSEIEVTFDYNLNGIVEINALERKSGRSEKLAVDVTRLKAETKATSDIEA